MAQLVLIERVMHWSLALTLTMLASTTLVLHVVDLALPTLGMGPAYIPLIALATWRLGPRWGAVFLVLSVALNAATMARTGDGGTTGILLARAIMRIGSYVAVLGIVNITRCGFRREHYIGRIDALTGAVNRVAFEDRLTAALRNVEDGQRNLVLAYIDLDDFKAINDREGHMGGDRVLAHFAKAAIALLPQHGCFGRVGGDEFAMLLELAGDVDARKEIARIHGRLVESASREQPTVGFSMGALIVPGTSTPDRESLLSAADDLMYDVKRSGKGALRVKLIEIAAPSLDETCTARAGPRKATA